MRSTPLKVALWQVRPLIGLNNSNGLGFIKDLGRCLNQVQQKEIYYILQRLATNVAVLSV